MASAPKMHSAGHTIVPGQYTGGKYLGVRSIVAMDQIETFYSTNLGKVFEALQKGNVEITGMPTGLYYTWDMEKKESDMAAAVGFKGDLKNTPSGMVVLELPAARSLTLDYMGGYHGLGAAHGELEKYMTDNKLEYMPPAVEEYITDPGAEPDSTKWLTKIIYFVK
jgi:effector-binding domain-containing protein